MEKLTEIIGKILGLPVLASQHGADVDKLIIYVHMLMGALFIGWMAYFVIVLVKFNHKANPKADYEGIKGHASSYLELVVAVIEGILLLGFAVPLWAGAVDKFPTDAEHPGKVNDLAQQFAWNVFYPAPDGEFGRTDYSLVSQDNQLGQDKTDPKGKDDFINLN